MLSISQDSRQCLLTWDDWQLQFDWLNDRWTHSLWLTRQGTRCEQWQSVEGTNENQWPGSPAFQDLFTERINDHCGEVQLLGQAGKNHYSGAIRCDGLQNTIDFDLAVRIQTLPPEPLTASTYTHAAVEPPVEPNWRFVPELLAGFPILTNIQEQAAGSLEWQTRLVMADLAPLVWERQRTTIRWKYCCRLTPLT